MRVVSSSLDLSAASQSTRLQTTSAIVDAWVGERPRDKTSLSEAARQQARRGSTPPAADTAPASTRAGTPRAAKGEVAEPDADPKTDETDSAESADAQLLGEGNGQLYVLAKLLRHLTGKRLDLLSSKDLALDEDTQRQLGELEQAAQRRQSPGEANGDSGWGLSIDVTRTTVAKDELHFSATGTVVTADGRSVQLALTLSAQHESVTVESLSVRAGDARPKDPLVLSFGGSLAELGAALRSFDLDGDGQADKLPTLSGGAYLALDRNGNGTIDDGSELFGGRTGDGFGELAAFDSDGNGFIDAGDPVFSRLQLLNPTGAEATGDQLTDLTRAGVGALSTSRVATTYRTAGNGGAAGVVSSMGLYLKEDGTALPLEKLDLLL